MIELNSINSFMLFDTHEAQQLAQVKLLKCERPWTN